MSKVLLTDSEKESKENVGDENPTRGNWTNKTEYILSIVGYAIGLGNIWRFPYLAYKNGGGAFLIPYFVTLIVCGIPMFFLETALGQFCSQGPINVWRSVPLLQGIGIATVVTNTLKSIYYNVIIAYSLYYMFASFQFPLPWSACFVWADSNCSAPAETNQTQGFNSSQLLTPHQALTEKFWDEEMLQRSSGLDETGPVVWHLALCSLLSVMIAATSLFKGIKSSGKVVYVTTTLPYVVIFILLIRGVTLEGAGHGIDYYIGAKSNLTKLSEIEVWKDAATQTFFSLSIAMGGAVTLASYNNFHNNVFMDALLVCFVNHGTSVFAGFAIFSVIGHMAHIYNLPIETVVTEGFGLAFIAYPDTLAKLPVSPLWSILFFFMAFTLGIDNLFTLLEVIITSLTDGFPDVLRPRRVHLCAGVCVSVYLLGLPCVTRAGIYWVTLLDSMTANWALLVLVILEIIGLVYIYGVNRIIQDIEMMIGKRSFYFWLMWRASWFVITPCVVLVIVFWAFVSYEPLTYGLLEYPEWGLALGWCINAFILIWIPLVAVMRLLAAEGNLWKRLKATCAPADDWQPFLEIHRGERYAAEHCQKTAEETQNDKVD
ncbi:sodium- and chloride-dependent neutral and basic amino acid transporter B(0+)-like [Synchiropus splendidus]|uniref:sodium- and chloride-dependent neutral and basic amino acid transporter B(0+)-like n=1 Tax=Synchiropus splendidus TaxID=270530 RepID=UPI00237E7B08|nr:sodium- and chloride-dependent neutral and basic amino acid transporter B(0+)-like [Synchiropus splendidus]